MVAAVRTRCALLLGLGAASAALGAAAAASAAGPDAAWARDPVLVYYPRRDCRGDRIELEIYDRDTGAWRAHPGHPRVPVDTCQVEDAGWLWNELRWRCEEPPDTDPPSVWVVGLDVFDPRVMEQCAVGRHEAETGVEVRVTKPEQGSSVRNPTMEVAIEGGVRMNGMEGGDYDVVVALDRSEATRREGFDLFAAELSAARDFAESLRSRLGAVRIGIVSYPNLPPLPGDGGTGARREIALGADASALSEALGRFGERGASGFPTFLSAFEYGLRELDPAQGQGARPRARKVLVLVANAQGRLPFGPGADEDASFAARFLSLAQRARERGVALHLVGLAGLAEQTPKSVESALKQGGGTLHRVPRPALESPFLEAIPLPEVRRVTVENRTAGLAPRAAELTADGRFALTLPAAPGGNQLRLRAELSDGSVAERDFNFVFDDSWVRDRLLAAERERIRRIRQEKRLRLDPEWQKQGGTGSDASTPEPQ